MTRDEFLEDTHRLGCAKSATTFHKYFKKSWKELKTKPISTKDYQTDVKQWTCHCGSQKYHPYLLCKHLVQAVSSPPATFWTEVIRLCTTPFYIHPHLTSTNTYVTQMMAASQMVMTMYSLETLNYLSLEVGGTLKVALQIPQCWEREIGLLLALVAAVVALMLRVSQTYMT